MTPRARAASYSLPPAQSSDTLASSVKLPVDDDGPDEAWSHSPSFHAGSTIAFARTKHAGQR
eukprot:4137455-Lingulodinium_polyedra.AAC.1